MYETRNRLAADIRSVVTSHVASNPGAVSVLADSLSIPEESVAKMLTKGRWDLALGVECVDALGLSLSISATP
ncbi:hypothetical protein [Aeromicrobium sp. 179-A 4D2 NHS]|uniref:hypothetical protein n=1 Tax=Aeromicrobium sp. 179-A 4D2 NHS TaxID=3142375 RepID=UPI00399F578E